MPAFLSNLPVWVFASLMANASIMAVEYLNRWNLSPSFLGTLRYTLPFIVLGQFGLWYSWRHAPHLLAAWLVFTIGNSAMRLTMVALVQREGFAWWGVVGVALMIGGALVVKEALHYGAGAT